MFAYLLKYFKIERKGKLRLKNNLISTTYELFDHKLYYMSKNMFNWIKLLATSFIKRNFIIH